ncbi:MAG: fructose-bisphosphatase class III [Ruminococcaceae bacterium]|nr:fructose-bisphosphatase class III [Oscillospiraceae bacterium]
MTYVMSDLHGQYEKYLNMLKKIEFSERDELYVLGDVVDRGPHPIQLLWDMSMRPNVYPLMGNHDWMAANILKKLNTEITEENFSTHLNAKWMEALSLWMEDGGETTLREFRSLSREDREAVLEYFSEFAPYEELEVGGNRFVLVHGNLPRFNPSRSLEDYDGIGMITSRADYGKVYYPDRYLITGHTPTCKIDEAYTGKIYWENRHIAVDCGAGWGLPLGCIRLEDLQEFYV